MEIDIVMTKKSFYLFYICSILLSIFIFQVLYLYDTKSVTDKMLEKKLSFVKIITLPDLAISTEATYIRHRSLSSISTIYSEDGELRAYSPSTFVYSYSKIINRTPSRILHD